MASALLNGVEHANFFETRVTEYSKAATRGNWNEVWDAFDKRKAAKAGPAANEEDEPGLLGTAAEQLIKTRTLGIEHMWNLRSARWDLITCCRRGGR